MTPSQPPGQLSSQAMNQTLTSAPSDVAINGRAITLAWPDGKRGEFPFAWLRDNCPCALCRHPGSGQRLLEPVGHPARRPPVRAALRARLPLGRLGARPARQRVRGLLAAPLGAHGHAREGPRLWDAGIAGELPLAEHAAVVDDPQQLRRWLESVDSLGFGLLVGVPVESGEVAGVAELFGHVRVTNYGRVFDVRSVVEPANLAYTPLGLGPHTDNPYRDPVPSLQLLHCLSSSAGGRREHARRRLLRGRGAARRRARRLRAARGPLRDLRLSRRGRRAERVRAADRARPARRGTGRALQLALAEVAFACLRPSSQPGTTPTSASAACSRTSASRYGSGSSPATSSSSTTGASCTAARPMPRARGERHLQGCYADIDGLRSTLAVLAREQGDD